MDRVKSGWNRLVSGRSTDLGAPVPQPRVASSRPNRAANGAVLTDFTGVTRFGIAKWTNFVTDPFHSLLNLPWWKFILVFVATYMTVFCTFALIYWAFPDSCSHGIEGNYAHALWMSSRTASTLGYDEIGPVYTCPGINLVVMLQTITSNLVDFLMLGIVFARFSAPFKRAGSVRFSQRLVISRHSSGYWALTFRVANVRKHQILKPEIRMLTTAIDSITPSNYMFEHLEIESVHMQQTNLQLGFPANVTHVIRPSSPLYSLSVAEMEARMVEVLVFVDGIDAMTSKQLQARKAYNSLDLGLNEHFMDMHLEIRGGKLGLDFTQFDKTVPAISEMDMYNSLGGMSLPEAQHHMQHLRHQTFKRLAEQGGGTASAANGTSAAPGAKLASSGSSGVVPTPQRVAPVAAGVTGQSSVELAPRTASPPDTLDQPRNPFAASGRQDQQQTPFSNLNL